MTVKAKRFRIGVEGATTDGREIQREWLEQMAASYNPAVYTALINLEHIKSYLPEAMVSRAATVPPVQRIEAPMQIIIQTQPGQSAQDIAREVARQLDERERRLKAKARSNYSDQGGYDA